MKFVTQYNFDPLKGKEKPKGDSMTVPNQTLSLKELLERHVRGLDIPIKQPQYYGEDEELFHEISKMDFAERLDLSKQIKESIKQHQQTPITSKTSEAQVEKVDGGEERTEREPS